MLDETSLSSIYIIGPANGPYKIGYAGDPWTRLSNLQVGQAVELVIHYSEETTTQRARILEKLIHRQLGHKRIRGEWYNLSLDEAIAEVKYAFIKWESDPTLPLQFKHKLV